jgi:hypothetical protein
MPTPHRSTRVRESAVLTTTKQRTTHKLCCTAGRCRPAGIGPPLAPKRGHPMHGDRTLHADCNHSAPHEKLCARAATQPSARPPAAGFFMSARLAVPKNTSEARPDQATHAPLSGCETAAAQHQPAPAERQQWRGSSGWQHAGNRASTCVGAQHSDHAPTQHACSCARKTHCQARTFVRRSRRFLGMGAVAPKLL